MNPDPEMQDTGVFSKKTEAKSAQEQMLSNPDMMTDMMKKNFSGIVPQVCVAIHSVNTMLAEESWRTDCLSIDYSGSTTSLYIS